MEDDVVELSLSQAVNLTNTTFIRASVQNRIEENNLDGPPVELVQFHVLIHCTAGSGRHMVDFEDYEMSPGTTVWIRPGQVQRWSDTYGSFDADVVVFESSSVPDLPAFERLKPTTVVEMSEQDAARLRQQLDWMAADLEAHHDHDTAAAVVRVVLRLFARHAHRAEQQPDTPALRLTTAFLESVDNNVEQRSVAWHARQVGASTRSIGRATADNLGQRPKALIDARVVLEAQRQLAWSTEDIATIARRLRFSEPSNFTKFFHSHTGTSPSAFREAVAQLQPGPPGVDSRI
ncbi:MAG: helix-turn-helix transcriptional regulator [Acidimicrobiales bacterium]